MITLVVALAGCDADSEPSAQDVELAERTQSWVPLPGADGWGPDDERGNGNTQSYGTRRRCAAKLFDPSADVYDLSFEMSATMPQALFADAPVSVEHLPTAGLPYTRQVANQSVLSGSLGQQGTQMDALGHFGTLAGPWIPDSSGSLPVQDVTYYNGFSQGEVKPGPQDGLVRLGIDKAPPIITSAVILDMVDLLGRPMEAGELITAAMIDDALDAQNLHWRGILPGDAVYIRTGYGERWADPDTMGYYIGGTEGGTPGLSYEASQRLAEDIPVLVGLDNPFTDAFLTCELDGSCAAPDTTFPDAPFPAHFSNLVDSGIHQIQNLDLADIADDDVNVACTMVLPLRVRGAAGSAVRPIAVGRGRGGRPS